MSFIHRLFNLLLPNTCALCAKVTTSSLSLCSDCRNELPILANNCSKCAQFLPDGQKLCGSCLNKPPPFDQVIASFSYQKPLIQLIIRLKFKRELYLGKTLGSLFLEELEKKFLTKPDLILPIPLHNKRLQERGFNQAVEIARPIAKSLRLPLDLTGATRIKETTAQSQLSSFDRKKNMQSAFCIKRNYQGKTIAVFDDVMTTGHTMRSFCEALKEKGAKRIEVWCIARCDIAINAKSR